MIPVLNVFALNRVMIIHETKLIEPKGDIENYKWKLQFVSPTIKKIRKDLKKHKNTPNQLDIIDIVQNDEPNNSVINILFKFNGTFNNIGYI